MINGATWTGPRKVNGALSLDGDEMFKIRIWDNNNEDEKIYNSGMIPLGGGQIKIHN